MTLEMAEEAEHGGVVEVPRDWLRLGRAVTLDDGMSGGTAVCRCPLSPMPPLLPLNIFFLASPSSLLAMVSGVGGAAAGADKVLDADSVSLVAGLAVGVAGEDTDESNEPFLIFCSSQLNPLIS